MLNIINEQVSLDVTYFNLSFFGEIRNSELEKLLHLKKLKHLNIAISDVLDKHLKIIGQLGTLEMLDLDSTEITDRGIKHLQELTLLEDLRLKDNPQLTDKCVEFLLHIKQLKSVHLGNTSITITGLKKLICKKELRLIILGSDFKNFKNDLLEISVLNPKVEILVKGIAVISNGKLK